MELVPLDMWMMPGLALPIVAFVLLDQWNQMKNDIREQPKLIDLPACAAPAGDINIEEEVEELQEQLPYDSWIDHKLTPQGDGYRYDFKCNSGLNRFFATGSGKSPKEAFLIAKHHLLLQIADWHRTRFEAPLQSPAAAMRPVTPPKVLIIDDDVDLALAMQTAFGQLGCEAVIETRHEGLHRKIISSNADLIFMDWKLNNHVTAGEVMERASRVITAFSDLRQKFSEHKPKVVTYSVLGRDEIHLPAEGENFFDHTDHWQKPMPFAEVISRGSSLLNVSAV